MIECVVNMKVLLGSASENTSELINSAHNTQHEKIIRGIAIGLALIMYGREEEADALISQLTTDKDPILRYGGMFTIGLAYCGTANNNAIKYFFSFSCHWLIAFLIY
jgi:26S proteasome regulatory subunit N2